MSTDGRHGRGVVPRLATAVVLAAGLAMLGACGDETPFEVIEEVTFDPSLGIDLSTMTKHDSGVYFEDLSVGTGPVLTALDSVTVDHTGWLRTGVEFSSGPFDFTYLQDNLILGFEIGIDGMAEGGVRKMVIPPNLAYDQNPPENSGIPKGAILVFEVELVTIHP